MLFLCICIPNLSFPEFNAFVINDGFAQLKDNISDEFYHSGFFGNKVKVIKEEKEYYYVTTSEGEKKWIDKKDVWIEKFPIVRYKISGTTIGDIRKTGYIINAIQVEKDKMDNIYVLDMDGLGNYRLQMFSKKGELLGYLNISEKYKEIKYIRNKNNFFPCICVVSKDICFLGFNNRIITFKNLKKINEYILDGISINSFVFENNNLYVLDKGKKCVKMYSKNMKFIKDIIKTSLVEPWKLKVIKNKIYVLDNLEDKEYVISGVDGTALYKESSKESDIIEKLANGTIIKVIDEVHNRYGKWSKVETKDRGIGFINKTYYLSSYHIIKQFNQNGVLENIYSAANCYEREIFEYIKWCDFDIDNKGNIYIFEEAVYEDGTEYNIKIIDKKGVYKKEIPKILSGWIYAGSSREHKTYVDYYKNSVKIINNILYINSYGKILEYNVDGKLVESSIFSVTNKNILLNPVSIAIDSTNNIYISDYSGKIFKYNSDGILQYFFCKSVSKEEKAEFDGDIVVGENGDIYITDLENYKVQVFDNKGKFKQSFIPDPPGGYAGQFGNSENGDYFDIGVNNDNIILYAPIGINLPEKRVFSLNGKLLNSIELSSGVIDQFGSYYSEKNIYVKNSYSKLNDSKIKINLHEIVNCYRTKNNIYMIVTNYYSELNNYVEYPLYVLVLNVDCELQYILDYTYFDNYFPRNISDIAVDSKDNLWIVDADAKVVLKYEPYLVK